MTTAADLLAKGAETFRERNTVYQDNHKRIGGMMHAMFPAGLTVNTPEEWTRLYLFFLGVVKKSRYAVNFTKGGHKDSVHDETVYNAMLEAFDEELANAKENAGGHSVQLPPSNTARGSGERRQTGRVDTKKLGRVRAVTGRS